jgi:hypothetical protein
MARCSGRGWKKAALNEQTSGTAAADRLIAANRVQRNWEVQHANGTIEGSLARVTWLARGVIKSYA